MLAIIGAHHCFAPAFVTVTGEYRQPGIFRKSWVCPAQSAENEHGTFAGLNDLSMPASCAESGSFRHDRCGLSASHYFPLLICRLLFISFRLIIISSIVSVIARACTPVVACLLNFL